MSLRFNPLMGLRNPVAGWQHGSPFHAVEELMREMDRSLGSIGDLTGSNGSVELYKTEEGWIFKAQVPGFSKEEIDLDISKNHISVNATKEDLKDLDSAKLIRGGFPTNLQYREQIPGTMDPTTAEAELVNGVLTITVKSIQKAPTSNKIVIK